MSTLTVPHGFEPLVQDGFLGFLDGICTRRHPGGLDTCLLVVDHHLNPNGSVHGGVLLGLLDFTLGATAEQVLAETRGDTVTHGDRHPATITLTTQFTSPAGPDVPLFGEARVRRQTRSLTFVTGELISADVVVATASGVFKNPPPR